MQQPWQLALVAVEQHQMQQMGVLQQQMPALLLLLLL
jgi:hypothetical protein